MFFEKVKPILTDSQLKILADIGVAVGQISVASMILPFVVPVIDESKTSMIILGAGITLGSWFMSLLVVRKAKI